ncbi:hypothetical protein D0T66_10150 [Dysgonomonas sp. 25]|nr:hypothetical protein [Dysgonomonas sp. 25]
MGYPSGAGGDRMKFQNTKYSLFHLADKPTDGSTRNEALAFWFVLRNGKMNEARSQRLRAEKNISKEKNTTD